jgi:hypothetical protein
MYISIFATRQVNRSIMIDDDKCWAVGAMRIGRGNLSTRRKPAPVPLRPPQIPHNMIWARTQAAAVESRLHGMWDVHVTPIEDYQNAGLFAINQGRALKGWFMRCLCFLGQSGNQ